MIKLFLGKEFSEVFDMWEKLLKFLIELGKTAGLRLLYAIVIIVVGLRLSKWLIKRLSRSRGFSHIEKSVNKFICNILKVAFNTTVIIAAAITIGIPATSFITILGSAGLAIGLALQGSLSNFAGSIMIMFFKPYKIGDYIQSEEVEGKVVDINIFYTILTTPDNKRISCPNGILSNSNIINFTSANLRRVDLKFNTTYDADIDKVKAILLEAVDNTDNIISDPLPVARLSNHGANSLEFVLKVWCDADNYWDVYYDLVEGVKTAFDKNKIEIPYPQMDVHLKNDK